MTIDDFFLWCDRVVARVKEAIDRLVSVISNVSALCVELLVAFFLLISPGRLVTWFILRSPFLQYLRYVTIHKWYVFMNCVLLAKKYRKPALYFRGIVHDWHKFLPSEFWPYMEWFYGFHPHILSPEMEEAWSAGIYPKTHHVAEYEFDRAWLFHQNRARHHWQYWVLLKDNGAVIPLDMPQVDWLEMVADWRGAGAALGKPDTLAWYEKNKDVLLLHPQTRFSVEQELLDGTP